ncbi:MAG: 30S ribosomal protein S7 [Kiritimatiellae bacterium]|jgi:small subunit ribosomal protein S7|nr:30S ribosomal protein S7 [Kiritimatiellia bacterium]MDD4340898.1 30S ribosomal protein S7 [Kiritimatiellia bacterium]MDY0148514.1 30S ribosomal protein S7 [Kiritimatiellia bacterium]
MRRRKSDQHQFAPDARYHSDLVTHLVNIIMSRGKKSTAQRTVYGALDQIKEQTDGQDPIEVYQQALENIKPKVEVKSRRVGGATYQVPIEVPSSRQTSLALRWIVDYSRGRKGASMQRALASEILDAYKNQGNAVKKRDETHKMAAANKAFAHYRW